MKRYYICPVKLFLDAVGDAYYAAKVSQYPGFNYVSEIPNKPDGTPVENWALCHVSGTDFSSLDADPEFELVVLDQVTDVEVDVSTKLDSALKSRGINVKAKLMKKELVRAIGKKLSKNFDEEQFKIGD